VEGAGILAKAVYSTLTGNYGGLQMPMVYSDNMVLQRDIPLNISGIADAGEKVTIEINGQKQTTKAAENGKWNTTLATPAATASDINSLRVRQ
jgi:sialate O-acetylesterase